MRHARLTWPGAFHHLMNRGHGGDRIFATDSLKKSYLEILGAASKAFHVPIFAYCLMDNHFHLIAQNAGGQLSRFMKVVHTSFGILYRHIAGGKGCVFQDRFRSTVIQDDSYLLQAVLYVLNNPVRAGVVTCAADYSWSSAGEYFSGKGGDCIDRDFVEDMFSGKRAFMDALRSSQDARLPESRSRYGPVLGEEGFSDRAEARFDRRQSGDECRNCRDEDKHLEPVEKVIWEFERKICRPIGNIAVGSHEGKQQRAEFLVRLRDLAGLTYREIMEFDIFRDLAFSSLGSIYAHAKKMRKGK
jgi:REP element-mobilizing transposase RayT